MINRAQVLSLVREVMETGEEVDEFLSTLADNELSKMVFHSPIGGENNLRLSAAGYGFLKQGFEAHEQCFEDDYVVSSRDLLYLRENCTCPYYLSIHPKTTMKFIALFERELATRVKIVSGRLSMLV